MSTVRARVDAHREASDGGKTVPGLFFFELDRLRMEKRRTGDEGRGCRAWPPSTIPRCWTDISQPECYTRRSYASDREMETRQSTHWFGSLEAVVSWILTPARRPRFCKRDARPSRCVTSYRARYFR